MRDKRLLVVAAGDSQSYLIRVAKRLGMTVIATDRNPEAIGFRYADHHAAVDIRDCAGTLEVAERFRIDGIVTDQTDVSVPTVAYVAEKLGLPGIGYEVARCSTDKYLMRERCRRAGLPIPAYRQVTSLEAAREAASEIGFPLIIKPPDNQGSKGVFSVENDEELCRYYGRSVDFSLSRSLLVEEKLLGVEATIEGIVTEAGPCVLAISQKEHLPPPYCISKHILYDRSVYDRAMIERILGLNDAVVKALGISRALTHGEFMITPAGPYLIEFAARGGGSRISSHVVPAVSGVQVTELLLNMVMGLPARVDEVLQRRVLLDFIVLPAGRVTGIEGIERTLRTEGLIDFLLPLDIGDIIKPVTCDPERHGQFIVTGPDRETLMAIRDAVYRTFRIEIAAI